MKSLFMHVGPASREVEIRRHKVRWLPCRWNEEGSWRFFMNTLMSWSRSRYEVSICQLDGWNYWIRLWGKKNRYIRNLNEFLSCQLPILATANTLRRLSWFRWKITTLRCFAQEWCTSSQHQVETDSWSVRCSFSFGSGRKQQYSLRWLVFESRPMTNLVSLLFEVLVQ